MKNHTLPFLITLCIGVAISCFVSSCVGIVLFETPASAQAGQSIQVRVRVKSDFHVNQYRVKFLLSKDPLLSEEDRLLHTAVRNALSIYSHHDISASLSLPNNLLTGEYYLIAHSSEGGSTIYSGGQNVYTRKIMISGVNSNLPDLVVTHPYLLDTLAYGGTLNKGFYGTKQFLPGRNMTLSLSLENRSNGFAGASAMHVYLSRDATYSPAQDQLLSAQSFAPIPAKGRVEHAFDFKMPDVNRCGSYYLFIVPDYLNQVSEYDENNIIRLRVYVPCSALDITKAEVPVLVLAGVPNIR